MAWNGSYIKNVFSAIALLLSLCADGFAAGRLLTDSVLNPSMFPGTERSVSVYATARCGGESALLLCFDGDVFASKAVLDSLVANGTMPPVVAVFVNPGVVKDSDGAAVRYNRSNEFDALTGGMPDFVVDVLLPKVGRMLSPLGIGISANPDMHAVAGASSGGIAAFTLAWRRPDVFRRVYCSVGTFVAMRGGDGYPALVRKTEPKPLRIFLHDGRNDAWNPLFGHWFDYNQLMESAMRFAGYDVAHSWDDGGHSIRGGIREFPKAMEWLWRDWTEPLSAGRSQNDMLQSLVVEGEGWEVADGKVEFPDNSLMKTSEGFVFGEKGGPSTAISPDHRVLVEAERNSDWLVAGIVAADGSVACRQRFYWLHNVEHCADTTVRQMTFDIRGNLFVATNMGVQVCDQNGRVRAILPLPGGAAVEAMKLVGDRLYAKSGATVYVRRLKTVGCSPSESPFKPVSQGTGLTKQRSVVGRCEFYVVDLSAVLVHTTVSESVAGSGGLLYKIRRIEIVGERTEYVFLHIRLHIFGGGVVGHGVGEFVFVQYAFCRIVDVKFGLQQVVANL